VLDSAAIIAAATTIAAKLIGYEGRLGVVQPGALADLIVVDGDPFSDAAILAQPERSVRAVIQGGKVHRAAL
jgi:imidazolonepropionase-like amidohydrolase